MKKIMIYCTAALFCIFTSTMFCKVLAQSKKNVKQKNDIVTMLNGEAKTGKVKSVSDDVVKFSYTDETVEYQIKKSEIAKIEFSNGRVEVINTAAPKPAAEEKIVAQTVAVPVVEQAPVAVAPAAAVPKSTPEERKNKIAVLPFEIFSNDPSLKSESFSRQVQQSCADAIRGQSPYQTIQDPMITNSILMKHHFTIDSLLSYTPQEWAEILGTEFVVIGSYSIENKGTQSTGGAYTSFDKKKTDDKTKGSVYSSNNSYTTTSYDTKVGLRIYNDSGNTLYSDTHSPAFGSLDSYNPGLKYMIKRTLFGKR